MGVQQCGVHEGEYPLPRVWECGVWLTWCMGMVCEVVEIGGGGDGGMGWRMVVWASAACGRVVAGPVMASGTRMEVVGRWWRVWSLCCVLNDADVLQRRRW